LLNRSSATADKKTLLRSRLEHRLVDLQSATLLRYRYGPVAQSGLPASVDGHWKGNHLGCRGRCG
jgi:hypothetical protein